MSTFPDHALNEQISRQVLAQQLRLNWPPRASKRASFLLGNGRNQIRGRSLYRRSRDEYLSRRSEAPAHNPPAPPLGLFFLGASVADPVGVLFHVHGLFVVERLSPAIEVSKFDQMAAAGQRMQVLGCWGTEGAMTETDQFWQYAKEALLSTSYAQTEDDRQGLLELARTWTQAALRERESSRRSSRSRVEYGQF